MIISKLSYVNHTPKNSYDNHKYRYLLSIFCLIGASPKFVFCHFLLIWKFPDPLFHKFRQQLWMLLEIKQNVTYLFSLAFPWILVPDQDLLLEPESLLSWLQCDEPYFSYPIFRQDHQHVSCYWYRVSFQLPMCNRTKYWIFWQTWTLLPIWKTVLSKDYLIYLIISAWFWWCNCFILWKSLLKPCIW